MSYNGMHLAPA